MIRASSRSSRSFQLRWGTSAVGLFRATWLFRARMSGAIGGLKLIIVIIISELIRIAFGAIVVVIIISTFASGLR